MKKRIISVLLLIFLLASLIPTMALAEGEPDKETVMDNSVEEKLPEGEGENQEPKPEENKEPIVEEGKESRTEENKEAKGEEKTEDKGKEKTEVKGKEKTEVKGYVAMIGDEGYATLEDALTAVKPGQTIKIVKADTYTITSVPTTSTAFTIEGDAEGDVVLNAAMTAVNFKKVKFSAPIIYGTAGESVSMVDCGLVSAPESGKYAITFASTADGSTVTVSNFDFASTAGDYEYTIASEDCQRGKIVLGGKIVWFNGETYAPVKLYGEEIPDYFKNNKDVTEFTGTGLSAIVDSPEGKALTVSITYSKNDSKLDNNEVVFEVAAFSDGEAIDSPFSKNITFRLPVTEGFGKYAKLQHGDDKYKILDVHNGGNGNYVQVTVNHLSRFTLTSVNEGDVVASIGDQSYISLKDALDDAKAGDTIKVEKPITTETGYTVDKQVTLDLNNQNIAPSKDLADAPLFNIVEGGNLTVTDNSNDKNGGINTNGKSGTAIDVNGGSLTVQQGKVTGDVNAVKVDKGAANISGGTLTGGTNALNVPGAADDVAPTVTGGDLNGKVVSPYEKKFIKGGTFSINPDLDGANLVADGYCIKATESGYQVGKHEVVEVKADATYCPHYICNNCKSLYTDAKGEKPTTENALKHTPEVDPEAKAPSCLGEGTTEGKKCSHCHYVLEAPKTLDPLGHNWDSGRITKYPTATTYGERTYTCQRCGATSIERISPTNTPITGDSSNMVLWISMLGAALIGVGVVFFVYKKQKKD